MTVSNGGTSAKESLSAKFELILGFTLASQRSFLQKTNDHKPLTQFLNGKNANNKVNRWSLELTTYNITFEWISGAKNKAADCLLWLVEPTSPSPSVHMLTASHTDRPAFNTRSCTQTTSPNTTSTPHLNVSPRISKEMNPTPKLLAADRIEALLQMQRTDPFCKCTSRQLLNGKA